MPTEWVIDASLLAAASFPEAQSAGARAFLAKEIEADAFLTAPDLLALELASIAAKKVWRGQVSVEDGAASVSNALRLIETPVAIDSLSQRAFALAAQYRFSAYDAAYLALAEIRGCPVATLDGKLVERARANGLDHLVHLAV